MNAVIALAAKEFEERLRNGWILATAGAFAVFALVIALAGFGAAGHVGTSDTPATVASLTSLVLYLIPLLGLLLGYDAIAGERERGTLGLLATYPVGTPALLAGKLLGLAAVLAVTLLVGLAPTAALAVWAGGAWTAWPLFAGFAWWLGVVFIALALLFSALAAERGTVLGLALAVWLVLVLLFDLALIGLLVATGGELPTGLVEGLFYLNPAGLFRLLVYGLLLGKAAAAELGLAGTSLPLLASYGAALALWAAAPLVLCGWRLRRTGGQ